MSAGDRASCEYEQLRCAGRRVDAPSVLEPGERPRYEKETEFRKRETANMRFFYYLVGDESP